MFEHPRCTFTVDFPKGPLAIGREYVRDTAVLSRGDLSLRILTPTDCVKDRLAHFFYWDDDTAFNAAVGVATSQRANIDVTELARWTHSESTGGVDFRPKLKRFFRTAGIERSAE
jgi:hypothetical protein